MLGSKSDLNSHRPSLHARSRQLPHDRFRSLATRTMAYPPPAQRPPPLRQYTSSPAPSARAQDAMYGGGYSGSFSDGGQGYPDGRYDDPGYSYQPSSAGPQPYDSSRSQPRTMRPPGPPGPPGPNGRPPPGYDARRGYPGDRPPPQKRSRTRE